MNAPVARPISRGDLECYHGDLVMAFVFILSGETTETFSSLSHRSRKKWLDKSVAALYELANHQRTADGLVKLAATIERYKARG